MYCMQDSFARARTRPKGARATIGYLVYKFMYKNTFWFFIRIARESLSYIV